MLWTMKIPTGQSTLLLQRNPDVSLNQCHHHDDLKVVINLHMCQTFSILLRASLQNNARLKPVHSAKKFANHVVKHPYISELINKQKKSIEQLDRVWFYSNKTT